MESTDIFGAIDGQQDKTHTLDDTVSSILKDDQLMAIVYDAIGKIGTDGGIHINVNDLLRTMCCLALKYASFKGGGVKGIAYVGVIQVLERLDLLDKIEAFIGASAGGLTAALLGFGLGSEKIASVLEKFVPNEIKDGRSLISKTKSLLVDDTGWDSGTGIVAWLSSIFENEGSDPNITFVEHQIRVIESNGRLKEIILIGADTTRKRRVIFSAEKTPHMRIIDALRITVSIPEFFRAIYVELDDEGQIVFRTDEELNRHLVYSYERDPSNPNQVCLVDGGIIDNLGYDLKNFDEIQNSRMMVFYLNKMHDLSLERQQHMAKELNTRLVSYLNSTGVNAPRKRDLIKKLIKSSATKAGLRMQGQTEQLRQFSDQRDKEIESDKMARRTKRQLQREKKKLGTTSIQNTSSKETNRHSRMRIKEKISRILGTIRKGQERNLPKKTVFIDPVPNLNTTDFEKAPLAPFREMAIDNGMKATLHMLITEAIPLLMEHTAKLAQKESESTRQTVSIDEQYSNTSMFYSPSHHSRILKLSRLAFKNFMQTTADEIYCSEGKLQIRCDRNRVKILKNMLKHAEQYRLYGQARNITVHLHEGCFILTLNLTGPVLVSKHEKWLSSHADISKKRNQMYIDIDAKEAKAIKYDDINPEAAVYSDEAFKDVTLLNLQSSMSGASI